MSRIIKISRNIERCCYFGCRLRLAMAGWMNLLLQMVHGLLSSKRGGDEL
jgi:hypothetical protein